MVTGRPPGNMWEGAGAGLLATRCRVSDEVRSIDGRLFPPFLSSPSLWEKSIWLGNLDLPLPVHSFFYF